MPINTPINQKARKSESIRITLSDLDPQQVAGRVIGHFQSCFPSIRSVYSPVFAFKVFPSKIFTCFNSSDLSGNGEQMRTMVSGLGSVSGQPVRDRCVVFDYVTRWKEDFVSWSTVLLRVFWWWGSSPVSVPGCFGEWWSRIVGFWEGTLVLFWGRYLCIYFLYYVLYYINSLCSGGFADVTTWM